MAARLAAKSSGQVGSTEWIRKEREVIFGLEQEAIQDFAFAFRNELEWLNEHMAEIFESSRKADLIQLMKTPARLKAKTPMVPRAQRVDVGRVDLMNLDEDDEPTKDAFPVSKALLFQPDPPSSPHRISTGHISLSHAAEAIVTSSKKEAPMAPPAHPAHYAESFSSTAPTLAGSQRPRDSDAWVQTQQSQQTLVGSFADLSQIPTLAKEFSTVSEAPTEFAATQLIPSDDEDTTAQQSFHSANEVAQVSSPPPKEAAPSPRKQPILPPPSPVKSRIPTTKDSAAISSSEPRRSGRLAQRDSIDAASPPAPVPVKKVRSPIKPPRTATPTRPRTPLSNRQSRINMSPVSPPKTRPASPKTRRSPLKEVLSTSRSDSEEESVESSRLSDAPTPVKDIVRKSSINFASLPTREPLTNKKKSTGGAHMRPSYVDKVAGAAQRTSWMGRAGNGKSLGASSKSILPSEFPKHDEERKRSFLAVQDEVTEDDRNRKRSKGEHTYTVLTKLGDSSDEEDTTYRVTEHSKASTRMLHEQIALLSKPNVRQTTTKTAATPLAPAAPVEPSYPQLPLDSPRPAKAMEKETQILATSENDEDDWIPMSKKVTASSTQSINSATVQTVTQSTPKHQKETFRSSPKKDTMRSSPFKDVLRSSPFKDTLRHSPKKDDLSMYSQQRPTTAYTSTVDSRPASPAKSLRSAYDDRPSSPTKSMYGDNQRSFRSSPFKSPGGMAGLKAATQDAFKSAKQKLFSSSVLSASARSEALSPPAMRSWREAPNTPSMDDMMASRPETGKDVPETPMYPSLPSLAPAAEIPAPEPRRTRSSKSRESREKAAAEEQQVRRKSPRKEEAERREEEERRAREEREAQEEAERVKAQEEAQRKAELAKQRREEKRQEEERRRKQKEELDRERQIRKEQEHAQKEKERREEAKRQDALREQLRREDEARREEEMRRREEAIKEREDAIRDEMNRKLEAERKADEAKRAAKEPSRPISRLAKPASRTLRLPKPAATQKPVSIRTASQRELEGKKLTHSNSVPTVRTMKEPTPEPGLHHSNSTSTIRNGGGNTIKNLKSIQAAAAAKKKAQEDAERKERLKQESDKRRAEHLKKQLDEEAKREAMQKQRQRTVDREIEMPSKKKNPPMSASGRPMDRTTPGPTSGPGIRKVEEHIPSSKRPLQELDDPQRYGPSTIKVVSSQPEPKRPRTGEYENAGPSRQTDMAPPVRPSTSKKEPLGKMAHGYASKPSLAHAQSTSKTTMSSVQIPTKSSEPMRSHSDKARQTEVAQMKTPGTRKTPVAHKSSPQYVNGESIELPDIPSESDDDSDSSLPPGKSFARPTWAESPELFAALRNQQAIDPEQIFGPMPTLHMEDVFRTSRDRQRFRARSSSANWNNQDRLTQQEIEADMEAQRRMIEQGGWSYGLAREERERER